MLVVKGIDVAGILSSPYVDDVQVNKYKREDKLVKRGAIGPR